MEFPAVEIVDPFETLPHAYRPGERRTLDLELVFYLGQDIERPHTFPIQLVDEGDNGSVAHSADLHQLLCLRLHSLHAVNDHQSAIDCSENSVSVFREILMPGCIEKVHLKLPVGEFHYRGGDGDASFFLDCHPIAGGMTGGLPCSNSPGYLNGSAKEEQFFR